jgi:DNA-binding transcriptional LysR family regulator
MYTVETALQLCNIEQPPVSDYLDDNSSRQLFMNWDDLRYFLALARGFTLSKAGRELKVQHTTVARRIKAFEENIGARLFNHLSDGYIMTQAGEDLYQHALVMEEQAHAVNRLVFGLDTQLRGNLKLTSSQDVLNHLVIPHLPLFVKNYSEINLQLYSSTSLADLVARQADIALRLTAKPPEYLIGRKVLALHHGIYASKEYLEKNDQTKKIILWEDETEKPGWVKKHIVNARVSVLANDISTIVSCVKSGLGLARIPCYIGDSCTELYRLDIPLTPSNWGIWVLSHMDLRATAKVKAGREFLTNTLMKQKVLIEGKNSRYL